MLWLLIAEQIGLSKEAVLAASAKKAFETVARGRSSSENFRYAMATVPGSKAAV